MIPPILPLYKRANLDFSHGSGVYLVDDKGNQYLDFASGYAANSLGHCHPRLVSALTKQANIFWHLSNRFKIPGLHELSKRLCDISFADTCFVANSGAEAVECMIKMCRRYFNEKGQLHKYRIITLEGAFHGRTLATATAGAAEKIVGFEPPVDGFDRVPWGDLNALEKAITSATAGILIEFVQGEGGIRAATQEYIFGIKKLCEKHDILLLDDEVQSGMGRTGKMFAYQHYGVEPDLMALGKGLGCGFPVSACLATERVGKAMKTGTHGSTFGGNPMAVAVSSAVLDVMLSKGFLDHVVSISKYLEQKLLALKAAHSDVILEITGVGLMRGIRFVENVDLDELVDCMMNNFLLSIPASNQVMRLTPPLIIERAHCDEAIEKIDKSINAYKNPLKKVKRGMKKIISKVVAD